MTCPCCHQRILPRSSLPSTLDPPDELGRVRSDIEGVDLLSTVSVLPTEILALIFEYACSYTTSAYSLTSRSVSIGGETDWEEEMTNAGAGKYHYTQLVLSAVSSHWRQVMLSMPQLWTVVNLDIGRKRRLKEQAGIILRCFLEYSQKLPVFLSLRFSLLYAPQQLTLLDETVDSLIYENKARIQELRLVRPSDSWIQLVPLLSRLANFVVKHCPRIELLVPSECSHLTLVEHYGQVQLANYHTLTVLRLGHIAVDVALNLLRQCSNLIEFRNRNPEVYHHDEIELPDEPFSLVQLEIFEWHAHASMNGIFDEAMCAYVRLPSLRTLLLDLTLIGCSVHNSRSIADTLPDGLPTERITLLRCRDALDVFLKLRERPGFGPSRLPKLKSVTIAPKPLGVWFESALADLLEGRLRRGAIGSFRLEIHSEVRDEYFNHFGSRNSKTRQRFMEIVAGGINLEIVENGEPVNWQSWTGTLSRPG
ncbi:hypothetical protein NP233_g4741 [Leucocoprinus birnbaumii]|uniref:F-box domain-containing protein n=1 Tax=Leucocoprinus birnbaumii TaxID=56174 RepID=A0AAD5VU71_9AGAR|nr:hypothetical protein NP233_g4741 [Leucocoprinus birnbaumii]